MQKRILLVDDAPDILDLLKYNLEAEGYEILTATDTVRAWELAQDGPDLIILEAMLSNSEDGWRFICKLRQMENTKSVPLICLTTKIDEKDNPCEAACEVNDYLTNQPARFVVACQDRTAKIKCPSSGLRTRACSYMR